MGKVLSKKQSLEVDERIVLVRIELLLQGPGLFHLEIPGREGVVNGRFFSISPVLLTRQSWSGLTSDFP